MEGLREGGSAQREGGTKFTIKALGANGAPLAATTARRKFPE
jgi:hypothetical protein